MGTGRERGGTSGVQGMGVGGWRHGGRQHRTAWGWPSSCHIALWTPRPGRTGPQAKWRRDKVRDCPQNLRRGARRNPARRVTCPSIIAVAKATLFRWNHFVLSVRSAADVLPGLGTHSTPHHRSPTCFPHGLGQPWYLGLKHSHTFPRLPPGVDLSTGPARP